MGNVHQEAKVKILYGSSGSLGENTVGKGRQEPKVNPLWVRVVMKLR